MKLPLKSLLCGIIAFNVSVYSQEEVTEESIDEECYNEQFYRDEWNRPKQYIFRFVPYNPKEEETREKREESNWPGKRDFSLFNRLTQ
ncbi:MAG: hypothetical protein ACSNEK_06320 [Parachlamydiaceae bacterium]